MNWIRSFMMIISAVLVMPGITAGQKRPRPKPKPAKPAPASAATPATAKRPVTVNFKEGDPLTGNFLRADAETVLIEVRGGRLTIRMSDVASLVFSGEVETATTRPAEDEPRDPAPVASDPNLTAVRKAYEALRKLSEAAKIKLPLGQYGNLLIETKPVVDEALTEITEYTLKVETARTIEAYTDAGLAWGAAPPNGRLPIDSEPAATLMRKYQIKPGVNRLGQADHLEIDTTLKTIWAQAEARLNYIAALLRR